VNTLHCATKEELSSCVDLFLKGFSEQISFFFNPPPRALFLDLISAYRESFPEWVIVAAEKERKDVLGCILLSQPIGRVVALKHFQRDLGLIFWRVLLRKYSFFPFFKMLRAAGWFLFFSIKGRSLHPKGSGRVVLIAVAEDCQGRGLGRQLLEEGLSFLRKEGFQEVVLEVRSDNKRALSLYRTAGFSVTGRIRTPIGVSHAMLLRLQ
jgi:ribosomal protein S18 acetylase RimI-like enzyme